MQTSTVDTPTKAQEPQPRGCKCEAQIAGILARLDKLEREALTLEKLKKLEPSKISQMTY